MTYPRVVVDLGSHTFHWVIASGASVETFERRGLRVALAAGLAPNGELAPDALRRAEAALATMGEALQGIPLAQRRVLATATFRRLRDPAPLQALVAQHLGMPAEVLSGEAEATLIWHGVAAWQPLGDALRCTIDVGGASTELAIGSAAGLTRVVSLPLGCVTVSEAAGTASDPWAQAEALVAKALAEAELSAFRVGPGACLATGGSAISAQALAFAQGLAADPVSLSFLDGLWRQLRSHGGAAPAGLPAGRSTVVLGELALLRGLLRALGQPLLPLVPGALADGALRTRF
jgi:exopolyphosphatase/guanosine-5'-triphosphate,3'-diphosphate pyrophosphatase